MHRRAPVLTAKADRRQNPRTERIASVRNQGSVPGPVVQLFVLRWRFLRRASDDRARLHDPS